MNIRLSSVLLVMLFCISCFSSVCSMGTVLAQTSLYVGGVGQGNYSSIQQALQQATNGDVLVVYPGEYVEQLVINVSVQLIGLNATSTSIHAGGAGSVLTLVAGSVRIHNLTITGSALEFPNAGVYVQSSGNTITNTILTDNYYGIVLMNPASHNTIEGNHIHHNHQCGIYFSGSSHNQLGANHVHHHPFNGFGLYDFSNNNVIEANFFSQNNLCGVNIRDSYENQVYDNRFESNTIGLHIPPPRFHNTIAANVFVDNFLVEQQASLFMSLPASIVLLFFGFLVFKRKMR